MFIEIDSPFKKYVQIKYLSKVYPVLLILSPLKNALKFDEKIKGL